MHAQAARGLWLGPVHSEARSAYERARRVGLSPTRALVLGSIASRKDTWAFRKNIAAFVGCSVRTVQRAITQAKAEGLLKTFRCKKKEIPPGLNKALWCGWSHRVVVGWGSAGEAVKRAVEAARARWLVNHSVPVQARAHATLNVKAPERTGPRWKTTEDGREWRTLRPEELQRELDEALARMPKPPPPE